MRLTRSKKLQLLATLFIAAGLLIFLWPLAAPKKTEQVRLTVFDRSGDYSGRVTSPQGVLVNVLFQASTNDLTSAMAGSFMFTARGKTEIVPLSEAEFRRADQLVLTNSYFVTRPTWTNFRKGEIGTGDEVKWRLHVTNTPTVPVAIWLKYTRRSFW